MRGRLALYPSLGPMTITVYTARRILTLNPSRPEATHVAVRDGRILGVGALEDLAGWG